MVFFFEWTYDRNVLDFTHHSELKVLEWFASKFNLLCVSHVGTKSRNYDFEISTWWSRDVHMTIGSLSSSFKQFFNHWTHTTFLRLKQNQICPYPNHQKSRPKLDHTWPWQPHVFYFLLQLAFWKNSLYGSKIKSRWCEIDYLFIVSYRTGHFWPWQRWVPTMGFIQGPNQNFISCSMHVNAL